jgi:hypothetical protein
VHGMIDQPLPGLYCWNVRSILHIGEARYANTVDSPHNPVEGTCPMTAEPIGVEKAVQRSITEERFQRLVVRWESESVFLSSYDQLVSQPSYKEIVALGQSVVPLLLREISKCPSQLVIALHEITGENPVPPASRGKIKEVAQAWVEWGKANGLI